MKTYQQPTIELLDGDSLIYVLRDGCGNLIGAGSPDVLEVLLKMSDRCSSIPLQQSTMPLNSVTSALEIMM